MYLDEPCTIDWFWRNQVGLWQKVMTSIISFRHFVSIFIVQQIIPFTLPLETVLKLLTIYNETLMAY